MPEPYAPPSGPPPSSNPPRTNPMLNDDIPDEAPPAYTPAAGAQGDTSIQAGPSHVDFQGPPPMPSRLEHNITGVGIGYGRRNSPPHQHGGSWGGATTNMQDSQQNSHQLSPPPPPPNHPSRVHTTSDLPTKGSSSTNRSRPAPPDDITPTESPTPGRPLLHHGMMLVYPKGHFCSQCMFLPRTVSQSADES